MAREENAAFAQEKTTAQELERRKLQVLCERYRDVLGEWQITTIGEAGFALTSTTAISVPTDHSLFLDFDDTTAATTESKEIRKQAFYQFLLDQFTLFCTSAANEKSLEKKPAWLNESFAQQLLKITDHFARWEELPGQGEIYHPNAHLLSLQWTVDYLFARLATSRYALSAESLSQEIEKTLFTIQQSYQRYQDHHRPDSHHQLTLEIVLRKKLQDIWQSFQSHLHRSPQPPFYFREADGKFILRQLQHLWSMPLEQLFQQSIFHPHPYPEITALLALLAKEPFPKWEVALFTKGTPSYQLYKILEFLQAQYQTSSLDFPLPRIYLTQVPKGEFMQQLVSLQPALQDPTRVYQVLDDNATELNSLETTRQLLLEANQASVLPLLSLRSGTKPNKEPWLPQRPFQEFRFQQLPNAEQILNQLLQNLYLELVSRLGPSHPKCNQLFKLLVQRQVITADLPVDAASQSNRLTERSPV